MGLRDFTLFDVSTQNARFIADRRAFAFERREVIRREHLQQVEKLAGGLADAGVATGEHIAILSQDSLEYVGLYGAAGLLVRAVKTAPKDGIAMNRKERHL